MEISSAVLWAETLQHLKLVALAMGLATLVGVPLGIHLTRERIIEGPVLAGVSVIQTIPSLALLGFLIPLFGIGEKPALLALFLYALLPIVRNTVSGVRSVDPASIEAGYGMGMREHQVLARVTLPQALPVIMAGVRTATVLTVAVATLCAFVGAGGLGTFIFRGIAMVNTKMVLAGAIPAAVLALVLDGLLALCERALQPASSTER